MDIFGYRSQDDLPCFILIYVLEMVVIDLQLRTNVSLGDALRFWFQNDLLSFILIYVLEMFLIELQSRTADSAISR